MICPTAKAEYFWGGGLDRANHFEFAGLNRLCESAVLSGPFAKRLRHVAESIKRRLQTFDDFGRDLVRRWQEVGIVERVVFEPEDVEIDLVARQQGLQRKAFELFGLLALGAAARPVTAH